MAGELSAPPALSTPAEHLFEHIEPESKTSHARDEDELRYTYEIERTAKEVLQGRWRTVALQFPDSMLGDAPWIVETLYRELEHLRKASATSTDASTDGKPGASSAVTANQQQAKLYILADTSYSSCCVDEIAAEHISADVVVHYGRSCLSPTSRLPVVYVFTRRRIDHSSVLAAFRREFSDGGAKIVLMADVTYQDHVESIAASLVPDFPGLLRTDVVHNPAGKIPNRRLLDKEGEEVRTEGPDAAALEEYSVFHLSKPPTALLLALSSRVKSLRILPTVEPEGKLPSELSTTTSTSQTTRGLLGRRYGKLMNMASAGVIGILVNTLSVSNYLSSMDSIRKQIAAAGKKSYTVVVGKLNPAKLANFAEIDGWVVIGCWESSLVEDDGSFFKPVITPFELEAALAGDDTRVWGGDWWGGIEGVRSPEEVSRLKQDNPADQPGHTVRQEPGEQEIDDEESEPPEFDWRTGKLVSRSRPMRVLIEAEAGQGAGNHTEKVADGALAVRPKSELATINGVYSPGAEYLRSQRTWQGLGSDFDASEASTAIEEGRSGVARGYTVGDGADRK